MKRLCVFCGSSSGKNSKYEDFARELGRFLAKNHIELVYGGANIGLMGTLANSVLEHGGKVFGVIPRFMIDIEIAHPSLTQLFIVDSMHERKYQMYELSDAFLAIPGGMGTLDELCEILTWVQLKMHQKPCMIYNLEGYFDLFLSQLEVMVQEGFLREEHRNYLKVIRSFDCLSFPLTI